MEGVVSMIPNREFKLSELSKINSSASKIDNMVTNGATQSDLDALANLTTEQIAILSGLEGLEASASEIDGSVMKTSLQNYKEDNLFTREVVSKATILSPATIPSYVGLTSITNASANKGFELLFTCDTVQDSNVLTNVSSTAGLVVGQMIYQSLSVGRTLPTAIPLGSKIVSIDSSSQVTISKNAITTLSISVYAFNKNIKLIGGVAGGFYDTFMAVSTTVTKLNPSQGEVGYAIEFMTDAANITTSTASIIIKSYRNGSALNSYRVAIDDVYQSELPVQYGDADNGWITIQFSTAGVHKVRVEFQRIRLLQNILIVNGSRVWLPSEKNKVTACFFGDSYFNGGDTVTGWVNSNIANRVAVALDWDIFNCSMGGTGYINGGGVNYAWATPERIGNTTIVDADIIVMFGSVNDSGNTSAAMKTACLTTWSGIRELNPLIPIVIIGVATTVNTTSTTATTLEAGMSEAFLEWNDSNSHFFPITTDKSGAWLDSTNTAYYVGTDGTHLNDIGSKYLSARIIEKIKSVLN